MTTFKGLAFRTYGLHVMGVVCGDVGSAAEAAVGNSSVTISLRLKIAQKPFIVCSLGPKASKYESLEP